MNIKLKTSFIKMLGLTGTMIMLSACASDPAPWTKKDSPWDSRRNAEVEAPAADAYKSDLGMPGETTSEVDLSYQAGNVESFAPEAAMEPAPVEVEEPVVAEEPVATGGIMDYPANYYTVQLMASVDLDRVYRFAEQSNVSTQYVVATVRDGVTWHVLLLDVYPDYSSAVAAKDEIAPSLTTQPWVRSVGSIQKIML